MAALPPAVRRAAPVWFLPEQELLPPALPDRERRSPADPADRAPGAGDAFGGAARFSGPDRTVLPAPRSPAAARPSRAHRQTSGSDSAGSRHWLPKGGGSVLPPRPAPWFPPLPAPCAERGGIRWPQRRCTAPHSAARCSCGSSATRCAAIRPASSCPPYAPAQEITPFVITCACSGSPAARRSNGCRCSPLPRALRRRKPKQGLRCSSQRPRRS